MIDPRSELLGWIDADRDLMVAFLSQFTQAKSPNPPGDTREAAACLTRLLDERGLAYRVVAPDPAMPNIVASFAGGRPGPHLVLNGHIDVYPVGDAYGWTYDPWRGTVTNGRVYGRGVNDMKAGTAGALFTFLYLHRLRKQLGGTLTLTAVSDEETLGPNGARYLIENLPEVRGDLCLSQEPTGIGTLRFGEKAPLWLTFTVRTPGSHGAYPHKSKSATKIAANLVRDLEALTEIKVETPENIARLLADGADAIDEAQTEGAASIVQKVTVNIGVVYGGLKVNMVPAYCVVEVDIRVPIGLATDAVIGAAKNIAARYPEVSVDVASANSPLWSDPEHEMVKIIQANVKGLKGFEPKPVVSLPATDVRLWRARDIPAYVYGVTPYNVAMADEYVEIEEFLHVVKTHALSAHDYLTRR